MHKGREEPVPKVGVSESSGRSPEFYPSTRVNVECLALTLRQFPLFKLMFFFRKCGIVSFQLSPFISLFLFR